MLFISPQHTLGKHVDQQVVVARLVIRDPATSTAAWPARSFRKVLRPGLEWLHSNRG
jgi:hypothetical protein